MRQLAVYILILLAVLPTTTMALDESSKTEHFFPLIADGAGFQSRLFVTNVSDSANRCALTLQGPGLDASVFQTNGAVAPDGTGAMIELGEAGTSVIMTSVGEDALAFGYMKLECTEPSTARMLLSLKGGAMLLSLATLESADSGTSFQFPVLPRVGRLAMVFSNDDDIEAVCAAELEDEVGAGMGGGNFTVSMQSTVLWFLDELIPNPGDFEAGKVRVSCGRDVAAVALPLNGSVFTALSATKLDRGEAAKSAHVLPLIQDGGGFRSQLLLTNLAVTGNRCSVDLRGGDVDANRFAIPAGATATSSSIALEFAANGDQASLPSTGEQALAYGYAAVECDGPVDARNLLTVDTEGNVAGLAAVPGAQSAAEMRFPFVPELGDLVLVLNNDSDMDASCDVRLNEGGETVFGTESTMLPSRSTTVQFLNDLFAVPGDFRAGEVAIACNGDVAAVSLPFNDAIFAALSPAIFQPAAPVVIAQYLEEGSGSWNQNFSQGRAINPLRFPATSGGEGELTYSLSPSVPGLTFDAATRQLAGSPLTAGIWEMTYTVSDSNGYSNAVEFLIVVRTVSNAFVQRYGNLEPRAWWMESEPYSCEQTIKQISPWTDAGLPDPGGSDPLSLIRYFGNGSYLRYGHMGFNGCTSLIKYPDGFYLDPPADPTYYSLGDLEIRVDIARVPPDASGWFEDDGVRIDMSMAEAVELFNTYVAAYFRRISQGAWRITFLAGNEFVVEGDGSPGAAEDQQTALVGACQDGCPYGAPGGLNRILLSDVAADSSGQAYNGWARFGLASLLAEDMELIVHEIGHGWMAWPHSYHEALMSGFADAEPDLPNPYGNYYDMMSALGPTRILGWDYEMPATLAINRYSAGWIRPEDVALHLENDATYTLARPFDTGYQFLVINSGRRHAFTTLEVLEERSSRFKLKNQDTYDPNVPGQRRVRRYDGVLVSRYDQTAGTGTSARFGPALYRKANPQLPYDLYWGRDDYSLIADGESRDIGGGVSVRVSKNPDGSFDVTVSGGNVARFETWCEKIWFSSNEFDSGCFLDRAVAPQSRQ